MEIWLRQDGEEYGPYTLEKIRSYVDNGDLLLEHEAWFEGCGDYVTIQDIPGLYDPEEMEVADLEAHEPEQEVEDEPGDEEQEEIGGKTVRKGIPKVALIAGACVLGIIPLVFIVNSLIRKTHTVTSIEMEMVYCRPGKFWMGSPEDAVRRDDETRHKVQLKQGFYLGIHEVTQAQWEKVMGTNPSDFHGASRPVEMVSWADAKTFCRKLTEMEKKAGRLREGWAYQLPTEAQWEYACRARSKKPWSFGDDVSKLSRYGNYADSKSNLSYADKEQDDGHKNTAPVGSYAPNRWGFHDMHGNVWEWCRDLYGKYSTEPMRDPLGPTTGSKRVVRGGGWLNKADFTRSAIRDDVLPSKRLNGQGFRCSFQPVSER